MDELKITIKTSKPQKTFSEVFKRQVVKEFEQGLLNKDQLQVKYGLGGNSTVLKWCRKYGKLAYPKQSASANGLKQKKVQRTSYSSFRSWLTILQRRLCKNIRAE